MSTIGAGMHQPIRAVHELTLAVNRQNRGIHEPIVDRNWPEVAMNGQNQAIHGPEACVIEKYLDIMVKRLDSMLKMAH